MNKGKKKEKKGKLKLRLKMTIFDQGNILSAVEVIKNILSNKTILT